MFRDVLKCSGMFHVPGFIDDPSNIVDLASSQKDSRENRLG